VQPQPIPTYIAPAAQQLATPPRPAPQPAPTYSAVSGDHYELMQTARTLISQNQHLDSLPHFEALIDRGALLDDVIPEISKVVEAHPAVPRARRLLGDAHMRNGDLQKALDTYRSALDKL
jgi:DNA-binding SARP family transcriptional activator